MPAIGKGQIGLAPVFTPTASLAYQQLAAFGVEVTSVHVRLVAPDGSTRDTSVAFPIGMNQLEVALSVPLRTAGQTFRADLELLNSDGVVLFSGSQQVVAQVANGLDGSTPASVQISYTGPGAGAKTVKVSPAASGIPSGGTLSVTAAAQDASGAQLSNLLVRWTTSDATLATVTPTSNFAATVTSTGKRGAFTVSAITPLNLTGSATLTVVPTPAKIVVISGGGQTGVAGAIVAQPLIVEVQSVDNLPVANAPVTFRPVTAGSVGTASATTDAAGRASTSLTLGQDAGPYQFEVTSSPATPTLVTATAAAAPAANIAFLAGNSQTGVVGTTLPQPVVVRVTNRFGAPVGGATVNWSTSGGGGTPATASSITASDGTASTTYRLGTHAQVEALRASLPGSTPPAEVTFSLTALADVPASITGSGDGQRAPAGTALPSPLVVNVVDQYGNPTPGVKVVWAVASGSTATATFTPTSGVTDVGGHAPSIVTLGSATGPLTITATVGTLSIHFLATADPGSNPTGPGTLSGFVFDAVSGGPLSGATVTVLQGSQAVATVTTNANGNFTTAQLPAGSYGVSITAAGYTTVIITTMTVNGNTQAPAAPMVPQSTQQGSIAGTVLDATNNQPVTPTVTLELRAGVNTTTGTPIQTVTTSQSSYTFSNVAAGTYTIVAKAPGYADATKTGISVGGSTTSSQNIFISPVGVAGNVRIVLTWRTSPRDLDSYLTGPLAGGGRFLVAYYQQGDCSAAPFACLDIDVTGGSGPETITISQQLPGIYRYSVNNYSQSPNIDVSGARVDVYINNALAQSFSVPQGNGLTWTVFELNGTIITPINTISSNPTLSRIPVGAGVSAARIPSGEPAAGSHDDITRITEGRARHPKRASGPR
ncbi:MAG: carboxypeptidase regulatory-like domain-containing protein [Gemmatimonadaceae bacterium]